MSIEISALKPDDAETLWQLVHAVAAKEMGFPEEAMRHYRGSLTGGEFTRRVQDPRQVLLAARRQGQMVGVVAGSAPEGGVATIVWLLVTAGARGSGLGTRLFLEACARYRAMGCHKIKLMATSPDAVRFYERCGMSVEGYHPDHWWHLNFWALGMHI